MTGLYDVHCHILPAVDDGAQSLEESVGMLKMQYENGVRNIIATPHYRRRMFETETDILKERYALLRKEADKLGMKLYLGCEYHVDREMTQKLRSGEKPTMAGSRYVLAEFSTGVQPRDMQDNIYKLRSSGFKPVVAHIERYGEIIKDLGFIEDIVDLGAYIQVNAESIMGADGFKIKRFCKKLLKQELVHFVGSDGHGTKHRRPELGACASYIEKKYGLAYAQRIFIENPKKIIENR